MEFDFASLSFGGEKHIMAWDSKRISHLKPDDQRNLEKLLDDFGKKSALAQGLQAPVTDIHRLRSTDQRLYLYMYRQSNKTVVLGGLKVGTKRLFVRTASAELREMEPVCVLDFYVHESCQRQGVGKALFEHFLSTEGWDPSCLAYDRPSPKLLAFLKKYYGLLEYVPQSNNYVVFNRYFELNQPGSRTAGSQARLASRGSAPSTATPHVNPIQGARSPPSPGLMPPSPGLMPPPPGLMPPPPPVHPGWGASPLVAPSPSAVGPSPLVGNSPSLGRRWATSTFGPQQAPFPAHASGQDAGSSGGFGAEGSCRTGDSLDAFSREHTGQVHYPPPHGQAATWEGSGLGNTQGPGGNPGGGSSGQPPGSRGSYSSRPPWAVDSEPAGGLGAGTSGHGGGGAAYGGPPTARTPPLGSFSAPPRSPLHGILGGGGGAGGGGPHTRALQHQLAAMQPDGAGAYGIGGSHARGATPVGGGRTGSGSEDAAATARIMAVAQRSGAGAADCLVW